MKKDYDAIVVGSGPNGLCAAITIAQRGGSVLLLEAATTIGGGTRSKALTIPHFVHDVCSAIHPMAVNSPFMRSLPLEEHGLEWIYSPSALAHPVNDNQAVLLYRSLDETASQLGIDGRAYQRLFQPLIRRSEELFDEVLRPVPHLPEHPLLLSYFGVHALMPASVLSKIKFREERARALFAGIAAHSMIPLSWPGTSAIALMLAVAGHARGWPIPKGGSQRIAEALASYFRSLGGEIRTEAPVISLKDLPSSRWIFLDTTPRQFMQLGSHLLSESQKRRLAKFQYGMAAFKMDFALSDPIPWTAKECALAATVHIGGTFAQIAESELNAQEGRHSQYPFVLLAQPSLFDSTRAPSQRHTAWAYCHVPHGSPHDMSTAIENQIERFAPGFKSKILGKSILRPADLESYNSNYIGGDISGGAMTLKQIIARPHLRTSPYSTSIPNVFLCSSSTPPGPGVHGMCGHLAALQALKIS